MKLGCTLLLATSLGAVLAWVPANGATTHPGSLSTLSSTTSLSHSHQHRQRLDDTTTAAANNNKRRDSSYRRALILLETRGGGVASARPTLQHRRGLDVSAMAKYGIGMGVQLSLIYGVFVALDRLLAKFWNHPIPIWANAVFFYLFNANTGMFSPLAKKHVKPKPQSFVKPSWTPPGWVFAIMWPLVVFGLRAITAAMIVQASHGVYATSTIMALMFHLSFGNLWNTM